MRSFQRTPTPPVQDNLAALDEQRAYTAFDPSSNSLIFESLVRLKGNDFDFQVHEFSSALHASGRRHFFSLPDLLVFRERLILGLGLVESDPTLRDIDIIRAAEGAVAVKCGGFATLDEIRRERDLVLFADWNPTVGRPYLGNGNIFASLGALKVALENLQIRTVMPSYRSLYTPSLESVVHFFEALSRAD